MKKILIILLITISVVNDLKAQPGGVPDTLAYLQTIVNNKAQYIGQPFSVLLNSMQIHVKYFFAKRGLHYDISKETETHFAFRFPQNASEIYLTYPCIAVTWVTYLNANQSIILWTNNDGGGWSSEVASFYNNGIIADIRVIQ